MKKSDLSRVAPLALSVAMSLALSITVVDTISAEGMKAAAVLEGSQRVAPPLLAESHQARVANAAGAS
jgi:hypothetical protein